METIFTLKGGEQDVKDQEVHQEVRKDGEDGKEDEGQVRLQVSQLAKAVRLARLSGAQAGQVNRWVRYKRKKMTRECLDAIQKIQEMIPVYIKIAESNVALESHPNYGPTRVSEMLRDLNEWVAKTQFGSKFLLDKDLQIN